jgi:hypothetical protein
MKSKIKKILTISTLTIAGLQAQSIDDLLLDFGPVQNPGTAQPKIVVVNSAPIETVTEIVSKPIITSQESFDDMQIEIPEINIIAQIETEYDNYQKTVEKILENQTYEIETLQTQSKTQAEQIKISTKKNSELTRNLTQLNADNQAIVLQLQETRKVKSQLEKQKRIHNQTLNKQEALSLLEDVKERRKNLKIRYPMILDL